MTVVPKLRTVVFFCGLLIASPSIAFENSDIALCQADPTHCAIGTPDPQASDSDPQIDVVKFKRLQVKRIFFGTNRKLIQISDDHQLYKISKFFSDEISDYVVKGVVEENSDDESGKIYLNSAYINFFSEESDFNNYFSEFSKEKKHKSFVYVHGVNNNFQSAIDDAAMLSDTKNNEILPFAFIWPSRTWGAIGTVFGRGYDHDTTANEESISPLLEYIDYVKSVTYNKVDIFAHSRGAYVVSRGIERISSSNKLNKVLNSVAYAAPDMDSRIFYDLLSSVIRDMNYHFTIYASENDKVISISEWKNYCENIQNSTSKDKLALVDMIDVDGNWSIMGHDFFRKNANVALDYREWLTNRTTALRRSLLVRIDKFRFRLKMP